MHDFGGYVAISDFVTQLLTTPLESKNIFTVECLTNSLKENKTLSPSQEIVIADDSRCRNRNLSLGQYVFCYSSQPICKISTDFIKNIHTDFYLLFIQKEDETVLNCVHRAWMNSKHLSQIGPLNCIIAWQDTHFQWRCELISVCLMWRHYHKLKMAALYENYCKRDIRAPFPTVAKNPTLGYLHNLCLLQFSQANPIIIFTCIQLFLRYSNLFFPSESEGLFCIYGKNLQNLRYC